MMAIEPITREEKLMAKASGEDLPEIKPITRREMFLAKAGGQDIEVPTPITREEMFLQKIAENGGGSGGGDIDALIDGSLTEVSSAVTTVRPYAFYGYTSLENIDFPEATSIGANAFNGNVGQNKITSASFPKVTTIGADAFGSFSKNLESIYFPLAKTIGGSAFSECKLLKNVKFPSATSLGLSVLTKCYALKSVDFTQTLTISNYAFQHCYSLTAIILRSEKICALASTYAIHSVYHFDGTVNATYNPNGLKDGYIYVPRTLIDSYKTATNWVTFADRFRALEDYTVDGTTTGELDESKVSL